MSTAQGPVLSTWQNVEMFAVHPACRGSLYSSAPKWKFSYQCCRKLNICSPPILVHFLRYIVAETNLREVIWQVVACELNVLVLGSFPACARYGPRARYTSDARICSKGDLGVLSSLPCRVFCLLDDQSFMMVFDKSSFDFLHTLLVIKILKEAHWSDSSCDGWFPYSFAERIAEQNDAFKVFG